MDIVKYSALAHMAETHSQARASFAIWTRANISQYTFNNL